MDARVSNILAACERHGADAVADAALRRMKGDRAGLSMIGLPDAITLGEAYWIGEIARKWRTHEEQAVLARARAWEASLRSVEGSPGKQAAARFQRNLIRFALGDPAPNRHGDTRARRRVQARDGQEPGDTAGQRADVITVRPWPPASWHLTKDGS